MATSTSRFGTSRREGHDASAFYARAIGAAEFSTEAAVTVLPAQARNRVFAHTADDMAELPDGSVALMVTSPPYHVDKDYDTNTSHEEFLGLLTRVLAETLRVLEPGGGRPSTWPISVAARTSRCRTT